jgi:hypothetical protein
MADASWSQTFASQLHSQDVPSTSGAEQPSRFPVNDKFLGRGEPESRDDNRHDGQHEGRHEGHDGRHEGRHDGHDGHGDRDHQSADHGHNDWSAPTSQQAEADMVRNEKFGTHEGSDQPHPYETTDQGSYPQYPTTDTGGYGSGDGFSCGTGWSGGDLPNPMATCDFNFG